MGHIGFSRSSGWPGSGTEAVQDVHDNPFGEPAWQAPQKRRDVVVSGYLDSTSLTWHAKRALTRAADQAVSAARSFFGPAVMPDPVAAAAHAPMLREIRRAQSFDPLGIPVNGSPRDFDSRQQREVPTPISPDASALGVGVNPGCRARCNADSSFASRAT
ncbi:hypothetical protein [Nonomuraea turcica]|uniref:hypothetical protein n=1 Tax=Nonomuraea sp. G32 TaxID=3067274 RepID=UPI00273C4760|nr:hypothetical protein [Nonomuraea sp. G32]MDP4511656.1 hypothetical protein [Nonomuraea sp. G32]